jgi:hypothetical protein
MRKTIVTFVLAFTMAGAFTGCKKNKDKRTVCRIVSLKSGASGDMSELSYDQQGRISRIVSGDLLRTYFYDADSVIATSASAGTVSDRKVIKVNALGLAVSIYSETYGTQPSWSNAVNEYDGDKLIKTTSTSSNQMEPVINTYQWSQHNITASISGTDTTRFSYYLDKPIQEGDYFSLLQKEEGYEIFRNQNLLKTYAGSNLVYEFNSEGRISSLQLTSAGSISILDYEYQCN